MANIKIELDYELIDGQPVTFAAPCDCAAITGLKVYHSGGSKVFTFKDAHGNTLTGIGNLFTKGAYVKAILDVGSGSAYLQNADTNAYLEAQLASKAPGGYGLGEISYKSGNPTRFTDASKLDDMKVNSFWAYQNSNASVIPDQADTKYLYGYTVASGAPYVTQRAVTLYGGSWIERTLGLRNSDGAWSDWKYVNPPMALGKTYLTTEFFLSKPVYKEVMNLGTFAAGGNEVMLDFNRINPILHPISCKPVDTLGTTFPYVEFKPDRISVATPGDFPGGTVYAVLTYTLSE
jgi:hypothetical protein